MQEHFLLHFGDVMQKSACFKMSMTRAVEAFEFYTNVVAICMTDYAMCKVNLCMTSNVKASPVLNLSYKKFLFKSFNRALNLKPLRYHSAHLQHSALRKGSFNIERKTTSVESHLAEGKARVEMKIYECALLVSLKIETYLIILQ